VRREFCLMLAAVAAGGAVSAQNPVVSPGGIVNHYSYALPGLPNANIARGSIFDIFGSDIGPPLLAQFGGFPIPTSIAGVSVRVTVAGTSTDVLLFFVSARQIVGILPSRTPVGTGTLVVTSNGRASAPAPITVVDRSIGVLTLNQAGNGPAAAQLPDGQGTLNDETRTFRPLDIATFYGTGGGPVNFDESRGAPLENHNNDGTRVFVGGVEARLVFKGRVPGLAGLDQFNVELPEGVTGCYVTVVFTNGNILSNFVSISISPSGPCADPFVPGVARDGKLTAGGISLVRTNAKVPAQGGDLVTLTDVASVAFSETDLAKIGTGGPRAITYSIGSCLIQPLNQPPPPPSDPTAVRFLDAGTVTLRGPGGVRQLTRLPTGYSDILGMTPIPLNPLPLPPPYYSRGMHTVEVTGAAEVGGFNASIDVPEFAWTNSETIVNIDRSQDLEVTWNIEGNRDGLIVVAGISRVPRAANQPRDDVGVQFTCLAAGSVGRFRIPALVLQALPPSVVTQGQSSSSLTVGYTAPIVRFATRGIEDGQMTYSSGTSRSVVLR
jgi:uncharacterized protein (TIGR03437 family)